jgi:septal ring factor EnvC (AmiA/AmiB activator)
MKKILSKTKVLLEKYPYGFLYVCVLIAVFIFSTWSTDKMTTLQDDLKEYISKYEDEVEGSQKMADTIAELNLDVMTLESEIEERKALKTEMVAEIERLTQTIADKDAEIESLK